MAGILGSSLALGDESAVCWQDWQPVLAGLFFPWGSAFFWDGFVSPCRFPTPPDGRSPPDRMAEGRGSRLRGDARRTGRSKICRHAGAGLVNGSKTVPLAAGGGPHPGAAVLCAAIMGLGTLCGGRRIIQKTAVEMVKIDKSQGTAADLSSAAALLVLSLMGLPVSTTHTKTAALTGCAAARSTSSVRLSIVGQMLAAWLLTFPLCGLLSWLLTRLFINPYVIKSS